MGRDFERTCRRDTGIVVGNRHDARTGLYLARSVTPIDDVIELTTLINRISVRGCKSE